MMKNKFVYIFMIGLSIFLYPIISNQFATTAYQSTIKSYNDSILQTDKDIIQSEKNKVDKHNEELVESDLNYVDPFEDNKEKEIKGSSYYDVLNLGPIIASIEIPKINVEVPIYHGTSDEVLSKGAGHLENSSMPTSNLKTHSVITAHRGLPTSKLFRDLDKLEIGDKFYINVLDETIAYQVESVETVLPNETEWLTMEEGLNKMTLLTCEPYMINTHRMLVTGKKIPYVKEEKEEIVVAKDNSLYYIILLLTISALFILYNERKRSRGDINEEKL